MKNVNVSLLLSANVPDEMTDEEFTAKVLKALEAELVKSNIAFSAQTVTGTFKFKNFIN
jgi:hypothetical protein